MDDILGPIPRQEELLTEIKSIEDEIKAETDESTAMVGGSIDDKVPSATPLPPPRLGPPEVMDMGSAAHRADPTPPAASSQPTPPPAAAAPDPKKKPPPSP
jgi:hypothetical protein